MRRAKGEGSLLKIYGKKDPVTGEKKAASQNWFAQYYDKDGRPRRVSTKTPVRQKALAILRRLMDDTDKGLVSVIDAPQDNIRRPTHWFARVLHRTREPLAANECRWGRDHRSAEIT